MDPDHTLLTDVLSGLEFSVATYLEKLIIFE